jgi:hypothetical protein
VGADEQRSRSQEAQGGEGQGAAKLRSFTDTTDGEGLGVVSSAWNTEGTPTLFVVDHKGVISYRGLGIPNEKAIDEVLEKLIHEAECDAKKSPQ